MDAETVLPDQGDSIIRTKDFPFQPNPKGLGHELYIHLRKHGDSIAQIDAETEETDTYTAYTERIIRTALHLRKRGLTPNDIVVPCTVMHLDAAVCFMATILSGAKVACVDPSIAYIDGKSQIDLVKPKIIFVSLESVQMIEKIVDELDIKTEIVVFGKTDKHTSFSEFLEPLPKMEEDNFEPHTPKDLYDTVIIAFSSGSTGGAKGICINHFAMISQTRRLIFGKFIGADICLLYSTFAWGTAQLLAVGTILSGVPNLLCRNFEVEKTWKYLVKYKVGNIVLKPHNCVVILGQDNLQKIESNLRIISIVGGKLFQQSYDALSNIFPKTVIIHTYGQTEILGSSLLPKPKHMRNVDYIGSPTPGMWYKVVDPDTRKSCGPNEQGELCIKSKYVMNGYYNQETSEGFDEDGYLKTGDIVYYDEEYNFFFVERSKDALKYKSYWLSPTYLESILNRHPAVKMACVIGIQVENGDLPTAIVVKANNGVDVTEEELVKFVNDQVTELKKIRGGVIFVEESFIEYTHSGKLKRYWLRRKVLEELGYKIPQGIN